MWWANRIGTEKESQEKPTVTRLHVDGGLLKTMLGMGPDLTHLCLTFSFASDQRTLASTPTLTLYITTFFLLIFSQRRFWWMILIHLAFLKRRRKYYNQLEQVAADIFSAKVKDQLLSVVFFCSINFLWVSLFEVRWFLLDQLYVLVFDVCEDRRSI